MRAVYAFAKGSTAPLGDYNLDLKILLLTFHSGNAAPPRARQIFPRYSPAHRRI